MVIPNPRLLQRLSPHVHQALGSGHQPRGQQAGHLAEGNAAPSFWVIPSSFTSFPYKSLQPLSERFLFASGQLGTRMGPLGRFGQGS